MNNPPAVVMPGASLWRAIMTPTRPGKECSEPGCSKVVEGGETRCEEHEKNPSYRGNEAYDHYHRDEESRKFYNSTRWRKARAKKLKEDPLCERCLEEGRTIVADVVDHIVPIKVAPSRKLDPTNFQSLCHKCHNQKSREDEVRYDL